MPSENNINVEIETKKLDPQFDNTAFKNSDQDIYGTKTQAVPLPKTEIGVDIDRKFFQDILEANKDNKADLDALNSFTQLAQNRDQLYDLLDNMAEDPIIAAVLRAYAENVTQPNDRGQVMWVESSDSDCANMVTFLLNTMNVDKYLYQWAYSLCKYGDSYFHLFRKSEMEDPLFKQVDNPKKDAFDQYVEKQTGDKPKAKLNEDLILKAYSRNDHYSHYIEMEANPAEHFELTRLGKTCGYITADVSTQVMTENNPTQALQLRYAFKKNNIVVDEATEYVHACLEDGASRVPETVNIFLTDNTDPEAPQVSYNVRRGRSLLYDAYQAWRLLSLLENSLMLNRLTKSQLIRLITIDVGGMPQEDAIPLMRGLKQQLEQKAALNVAKYIEEYTNPGPIENNIYWTTRNGQGNITIQNIGGEYDPKSLIDVEYYRDKLFGALSMPKQFFGFTGDSAGFDAGKSLSIISAQTAKKIKSVQNALIQALTDAVNLMLLDKQLDRYINRFQLRMTEPITQEELDRRENVSNRIAVATDAWNLIDSIEDPVIALKIKKALLTTTLADSEVIQLVQKQIDQLEVEEEKSPEMTTSAETEEESEVSVDQPGSLSAAIGEDEVEETQPEEPSSPEETILPSAADLGLDFTDNNNPEFS